MPAKTPPPPPPPPPLAVWPYLIPLGVFLLFFAFLWF